MAAREDAEALRNRAYDRSIPRHEEGGASAPPPPKAADTAAAKESTSTTPIRTFRCDKHGGVYASNSECRLCFDERTASLRDGAFTAAQFCAEAARLVGGPRAATHGDKSLNFQNIAELWNGYWRAKCRMNGERLTTPFTAHDVGCMMELFKIARRFSGTFNADDYIDAAGYAGCAGEIAAKEATRA